MTYVPHYLTPVCLTQNTMTLLIVIKKVVNNWVSADWQTCGFQKVLKVFVFLTGEGVENPDNKKKNWNKGENQQQTPPIWMLIWTDLFEPTAQFPCPQIQWEWLLGYVSSVSS